MESFWIEVDEGEIRQGDYSRAARFRLSARVRRRGRAARDPD